LKVVYRDLDPEITNFHELPVAYDAEARKAARRRAALAGYRLADELNRLFARQSSTPAGGDLPPDLSKYVELGKYYIAPVTPRKDQTTGFVVGGKNETELIRGLKEINGLNIDELERDMRPGAASTTGFLGPDEKLLDVMAADNETVLKTLQLTHQELAKHLHAMWTIGCWQNSQKTEGQPVLYHGRRFKVAVLFSRGSQPSPFKDGTESGSIVNLENLDNGKKLQYGALMPYMIDRYGFYEGKGTPWRLDPTEAVGVLDFLGSQTKKP
jgi:hypothetical protein